MINLLFLTIFPILVGLTIFLFNIGTKEIIDGKNGFNESYNKSMAYAVITIFLIPVIYALLLIYYEIIKIYLVFLVLISIIGPGIIYVIFYILHKNRLKIILSNRRKYEPDNKIEVSIFIFLIVFLFLCSILITINSLNMFNLNNLDINILSESIKSENTSVVFLIKLLITVVIPYVYMVIASGYIYNYSRLFGFVKQELIFTEEGKDILKSISNELEKKKIEAYILVESDKYITFKINGYDLEAIKIKSEYLVARKSIENQKETSIWNKISNIIKSVKSRFESFIIN